MYVQRSLLLLAGVLAAGVGAQVQAASQAKEGHTHQRLKQAQRPHQRQALPPSVEQSLYQLPPTTKPRVDLLPPNTRQRMQALATTPECKNMDTLATYRGSALADYLVSLPDYECTYPLFSLNATQVATIYSASNFAAVVSRFTSEAGTYSATNRALVNLTLYLRAGYYLAGSSVIPAPSATQTTALRSPIRQLAEGSALFRPNPAATTNTCIIWTGASTWRATSARAWPSRPCGGSIAWRNICRCAIKTRNQSMSRRQATTS